MKQVRERVDYYYLGLKIGAVMAFIVLCGVTTATVYKLGNKTVAFENSTLQNENHIGTSVNQTLVRIFENITSHLNVTVDGVVAHSYYNSTTNDTYYPLASNGTNGYYVDNSNGGLKTEYSKTLKNYSATVNSVNFNTGFSNK